MNVGLIYDDRFLEHDTGPGHPERSDRLRAVTAHLKQMGLWQRMTALAFEPAELEVVQTVHDAFYIERLRGACAAGATYIDVEDSAICPASWDAALLAAGGVVAAVDAVMAGHVRRAFCAVRPPGHHAERDRSMGFCLFNNVAIAAQRLTQMHGAERVAIVDFDVHHGNGTQHTFEHRGDVLFISLHEDPRILYPGTGFAEETGLGDGVGFTLNIPMPPLSDDAAYAGAFDEQVVPKLNDFAPHVLLVSAGFDASQADPLAHQQVTTDGFRMMCERLMEVANHHCEGRAIATLEGGYDLEALGEGVGALVQTMLKDDPS